MRNDGAPCIIARVYRHSHSSRRGLNFGTNHLQSEDRDNKDGLREGIWKDKRGRSCHLMMLNITHHLSPARSSDRHLIRRLQPRVKQQCAATTNNCTGEAAAAVVVASFCGRCEKEEKMWGFENRNKFRCGISRFFSKTFPSEKNTFGGTGRKNNPEPPNRSLS